MAKFLCGLRTRNGLITEFTEFLRALCVENQKAQRTRRTSLGLRFGRPRFYFVRLAESRPAGETYRVRVMEVKADSPRGRPV
jgi:DNA invertase Pin-like site-specific DNA recombinase